jgi:hypothetical protein
MLDFMVIGLPRSGTTWAANWLTGERTFCVHDPLWTMHYLSIDMAVPRRAGNRMAGVSCTALWRWPDWLRQHPARKLIVHRDIQEIARSMAAVGLPPVGTGDAAHLVELPGMHVPWADLFDADRAEAIWDWLTAGLPFDRQRHAELLQIKIEPRLEAVVRDIGLNRRLGAHLRARR